MRITIANHEGLNPALATPELAISIKLDSQILKIMRVKETRSTIISIDGVAWIDLSTSVGIDTITKIIIARLTKAHLFLGTIRSEALKIMIFNIGLGLGS
jgi:hypothetical protein